MLWKDLICIMLFSPNSQISKHKLVVNHITTTNYGFTSQYQWKGKKNYRREIIFGFCTTKLQLMIKLQWEAKYQLETNTWNLSECSIWSNKSSKEKYRKRWMYLVRSCKQTNKCPSFNSPQQEAHPLKIRLMFKTNMINSKNKRNLRLISILK